MLLRSFEKKVRLLIALACLYWHLLYPQLTVTTIFFGLDIAWSHIIVKDTQGILALRQLKTLSKNVILHDIQVFDYHQQTSGCRSILHPLINVNSFRSSLVLLRLCSLLSFSRNLNVNKNIFPSFCLCLSPCCPLLVCKPRVVMVTEMLLKCIAKHEEAIDQHFQFLWVCSQCLGWVL